MSKPKEGPKRRRGIGNHTPPDKIEQQVKLLVDFVAGFEAEPTYDPKLGVHYNRIRFVKEAQSIGGDSTIRARLERAIADGRLFKVKEKMSVRYWTPEKWVAHMDSSDRDWSNDNYARETASTLRKMIWSPGGAITFTHEPGSEVATISIADLKRLVNMAYWYQEARGRE